MADAQDRAATDELVYVKVILPENTGSETPEHLVHRILSALGAHPETRPALNATANTVGEGGIPPYATRDTIGGQAPPEGVPFFDAATGVLYVLAPQHDAVGTVERAVQDMAPGIRVEPSLMGATMIDGHGPSGPR